jgi:hypothetical protein
LTTFDSFEYLEGDLRPFEDFEEGDTSERREGTIGDSIGGRRLRRSETMSIRGVDVQRRARERS